MSGELQKVVGVLNEATERLAAKTRNAWAVAIAQAVIGGIVAAAVVLAGLQIK